MNGYNLYMLGGLGYDSRIFSKLELPTPMNYLSWIEPTSYKESMTSYVRRMAKQITHSKKVVLVGYSFGGMVAQNLAAEIGADKVILVSSIKSEHERPKQFDLLKRVPLKQLVRPSLVGGLLKRSFPYWGQFYGYHDDTSQQMFVDMFHSRSDEYFQWAISQVAKWSADTIDCGSELIHLHGDKDNVFPLGKVHNPTIIEGGCHLMIYNMADTVSKHIIDILSED